MCCLSPGPGEWRLSRPGGPAGRGVGATRPIGSPRTQWPEANRTQIPFARERPPSACGHLETCALRSGPTLTRACAPNGEHGPPSA